MVTTPIYSKTTLITLLIDIALYHLCDVNQIENAVKVNKTTGYMVTTLDNHPHPHQQHQHHQEDNDRMGVDTDSDPPHGGGFPSHPTIERESR